MSENGDPVLDEEIIKVEITAACDNLGSIDANDGTYMKDRDCKSCLREISRYLRADTKQFVARTQLGALNVIKTDFIPLLVQYCDYNDGDPDMFTQIIRLSTNLTSPVAMLFENQEIPKAGPMLIVYNKLVGYLYRYKESFASEDKFWSTINVYLRHTKDDDITFERILILIRNILHIPINATGDVDAHSDFDPHQICLNQMNKSGMLDTIIQIASETQRGTEYCFHLMEIVYLMLRNQNPETLAIAEPSNVKSKIESNADKKRLAELIEIDKRNRAKQCRYQTNMMFKSSSFVAQACRSIGDKPLIVNKPIQSLDEIKLDHYKNQLRKAKNRKPINSSSSIQISDTNKTIMRVSYCLKVFCKHFVERVYNNFMLQMKHNLIQKKAQDNDETHYLWAIKFFASFNTHMKLSIDNIAETLSTSTLHYIHILISAYQDKIKLEKKNFHEISHKLHLAIRTYREILILLQSPHENYQKVNVIKKNMFAETEYSALLISLFQQYEEPKHSLHYLSDLIETNYAYIELYDSQAKAQGLVDDNDDKDDEDAEVLDKSKQPVKKNKKTDFRTNSFMLRYCCPSVVSAHLKILLNFKANSDGVNLAILRLFERIAYDCKYEIILFQLSVFRCLIDIMDYHSPFVGKDRFIDLGKYLIENFGTNANKKRWMFQELLFWKTTNDVLEIENAIDPPPVQSVLLAQDDLDEPIDPMATDLMATDPMATDPMATDPMATDPMSTDPMATDNAADWLD